VGNEWHGFFEIGHIRLIAASRDQLPLSICSGNVQHPGNFFTHNADFRSPIHEHENLLAMYLSESG